MQALQMVLTFTGTLFSSFLSTPRKVQKGPKHLEDNWQLLDKINGSTHLACSDLGLPFGSHIVLEGLLVSALTLAIAGLHCELRGKNVCKLGSIPVPTSSDLGEAGGKVGLNTSMITSPHT